MHSPPLRQGEGEQGSEGGGGGGGVVVEGGGGGGEEGRARLPVKRGEENFALSLGEIKKIYKVSDLRY